MSVMGRKVGDYGLGELQVDGAEECVLVKAVGFFFFSSRRRHTRFDCDWSSDVCSSDLPFCARVPIGRTQSRARTMARCLRCTIFDVALSGCFSRVPSMHSACTFIHRRSEEHTSELQSQSNLVCRLLLEKKKKQKYINQY